MLDQMRKDVRQDENDFLPQQQSPLNKRKIVFTLLGASFAVLFFMFLMGAFRSDDEALQTVASLDAQTGTSFEKPKSLDEQLQAISSRLETLEKVVLANAAAPTAASIQPAEFSSALASNTSLDSASLAPLSSNEEACAMTNSALRKLIAANVQETVQKETLVTATAAKAKSAAKGAKAKAKKTAQALASLPSDRIHVVQKGETLSKISLRYFGTPNRWKAIFEANRDRISNINSLKVGSKIVIPEEQVK